MIDGAYVPPIDRNVSCVTQSELEQAGFIRSKTAGRFEIIKRLPQEAESFDTMFDYADVYGKFRMAAIDSPHKISYITNKEIKSASAFGGELGMKTAEYNGFLFNVATNISQNIYFANPGKDELNEDFFGRDKDSFAYVSQASINYYSDYFHVRVGRIKVETPYANSDDIRMSANTFEGAKLNIDYTNKLRTEIMYLNRWAGYDSQDEKAAEFQNEFKNLVSDESLGLFGIAMTYKYDSNSDASLWYNYIDKMSAIIYAEVAGVYSLDKADLSFDYGLQLSNIKELENSGIAGNVVGAMGIVHYHGAFLGGAYNKAFIEDGKFITDGFGGGALLYLP
ncbi:OprD family outer membrane porin [bacterium]|nr:OprD family outer membrane porin [bacterium]MBU1989792.1 OprD family outer membrane porin [bacterium]